MIAGDCRTGGCRIVMLLVACCVLCSVFAVLVLKCGVLVWCVDDSPKSIFWRESSNMDQYVVDV